jgi:anti-sigma factor RsiW
MSQSQDTDELMHAVLDGECSLEQRAELDRLLAADPEARAKFSALRALFGAMSQLPEVEPPADLLDAALSRFDAIHENSDDSRQLFGQSRVIYPTTQGLKRQKRPANRFFEFIHSIMESSMNPQPSFISTTKGRLIIAAGAVAALAVVVFISQSVNWPTSDKDTVGTIVPADRYQAPQTGGDDVSGGGAASATSGSVDTATDNAAANSVDHAAEHATLRGAEHTAERGAEHTAERGAEHTAERGAEHTAERGAEHSAEHVAEHTAEHVAEHTAEHVAEHTTDHTAE